VSVACWIIVGLTARYPNSWAKSMHIQRSERHLVVNGASLVMNCITFDGSEPSQDPASDKAAGALPRSPRRPAKAGAHRRA